MITIDRTFKNEVSNINTASYDRDIVETTTTTPVQGLYDTVLEHKNVVLDRNEQEHLIEQLALSKEEIKRLKHELDTEKAKTDRLKDYYESLIKGYRTMVSDMNEKLKAETQRVEDMVCAISNITKVLAEK